MVNKMFSAFDVLCDKHDVYKVETIGDSYMIVGGLDNSPEHAERVLRMAIDMLLAMQGIRMPGDDSKHVSIRIGMHSGPVRAGVVGTKMPRYTFFGDAVNTASRMESNSFADSIVLSESSYSLLKNTSTCHFEQLPVRNIKGKGPMITYLVKHPVCAVERVLASIRSLVVAGDDMESPDGASTEWLTDMTRKIQQARQVASGGFGDVVLRDERKASVMDLEREVDALTQTLVVKSPGRSAKGSAETERGLWEMVEMKDAALYRLSSALQEERRESEAASSLCAQLENELARTKHDLGREQVRN